MYPQIRERKEMRNSGVEYPGGSHAFTGDGPTQDFGIEPDGNPEGPDCDPNLQAISKLEEEAVLGKSFLGIGPLC